jgi:hypothetical protein
MAYAATNIPLTKFGTKWGDEYNNKKIKLKI